MRWGLVGALVLLGVGCDAGVCDAVALQDALDTAGADGVVEAGACRIEGSLRVPAGVTLHGQGVGETIVASPSGTAIELADGARLEALTVEVTLGTGVHAIGAATVTLRDVRIEGPLDAESASSVPPMPSSDETATHGLVLESCDGVLLERVEASGFGRFGVLALDSTVRWEGGAASDNLGTGVMVRGGSIAMFDVEVCRTMRGLQPFAYGAVFSGGASVESDRLTLCNNEGPGALHDDVAATHREANVRSNAESGLWVQRGRSFELAGALLDDNALCGLVIVETNAIQLSDTEIRATRLATTIVGRLGEVRAGDGIHAILANGAELHATGLTVSGNARIGMLLQIADGALPADALQAVVVEASGDALGAIAQTETAILAPDALGAGLERRGAAVANDAAVLERLDVLGAVAPMFFPPAD